MNKEKFGIKEIESVKIIDKKTGKVIQEFKKGEPVIFVVKGI